MEKSSKYIKRELVKQLVDKLDTQYNKLNKYYDYYKGQHDILKDYPETAKSNNIEVHNFCGMFIDDNTGFLLGNPIQLQSKDVIGDEVTLIDVYQNRLGSYVQQHDQHLMKFQQIFGYTYELNYINKAGEFAISVVSPLHMAVQREGRKVVCGVRFVGNYDEEHRIFNVFNVLDNNIYNVIVNQDNEVVSEVEDSFRANPIDNPIIVVQNNHEEQSEIEPIKNLNDAYNQVSSDLTNEISDHRQSYLHFSGIKITPEIMEQAKKSGILQSPEAQGRIEYLTKEINDSFVQNKLSQLESRIYEQAGQVNFNDTNVGSNTSSLALRNKLTKLVNKLSLKEGFIKEAVTLRLRNLAEYESILNNSNYLEEYEQIEVSFIMNIPTSNKETSEMVINLYNAGLLSRESAITQLSFVNDTAAEINKIKADESEKDSISNLYEQTMRQMSELDE